jgi:catechol 2,3-dioxygenase-like lactoylglutathione lyase family enzyme
VIDLRLHHFGIVVADIAKAIVPYVTQCGYELRTDVIHDPTQTAYVQFLRRPGETVLLELVAPDGPSSKLAAALERGGGFHHVCHSTPDIDDACRVLRSGGFFLIAAPVPAVAFDGRRIAWLLGRDRSLVELVERGPEGSL